MSFVVSIRKPGVAVVPSSLADHLVACHGRIRHFTSAAKLLGERWEGRDQDVRDMARAVTRYFSIALPLHAADEDESIAPRLRRVAPTAVVEALARMTEEHGPIEAAIAAALPFWTSLEEDPHDDAVRAACADAGHRLHALFGPHLDAEEAIIFPALARLPEAEIAVISAELRQRRGG